MIRLIKYLIRKYLYRNGWICKCGCLKLPIINDFDGDDICPDCEKNVSTKYYYYLWTQGYRIWRYVDNDGDIRSTYNLRKNVPIYATLDKNYDKYGNYIGVLMR